MSVVPSASSKMFSSNYQSVNFPGVNNGNSIQTNYNERSTNDRVQQWAQHMQQLWQPMAENTQQQNYNYQQYSQSNMMERQKLALSQQQSRSNTYHPCFNSTVTSANPDPSPVQYQSNVQHEDRRRMCNTISQSYPIHTTQRLRSHHAQISVVRNSNGGFSAVVKRKRKRTMFTTEQVEYLEAVFRKKSYVNSDERRILMERLKVSDSTVKVWFQNRRIRGKKDLEDARQEHELTNQVHQEVKERAWDEELAEFLKPINAESSNSSSNSSPKSTRIDELEMELNQKVDEFDNIIIDEKSMRELVDLIDISLPKNLDLNVLSKSLETKMEDNSFSCLRSEKVMPAEDKAPPEKLSSSTDNTIEYKEGETPVVIDEEVVVLSSDTESDDYHNVEVDSVDSTYTGSIYEPISPAMSDSSHEQGSRWQPLAPKKSLQRLFDLHFC